MSGSYRRDRGALVALGMALLAIVLASWFSQPPNSANAQQKQPYASANQDSADRSETIMWPEFSPSDTYAQWIMAILSLIATGISAWAVVLIRDTLVETRRAVSSADDAVEVTRQIGEAQVRAYLVCLSAKYHLIKGGFMATLEIENTGQSPASNVAITGTVTIHDVGGRPSHTRVLAWAGSEIVSTQCQPVAAHRKTSESIVFFDSQFPPDEWHSEEFVKAVVKGGNEIWFDLHVKWTDVFGKRQELPVDLSAVIDSSPNNLRKKRTKVGRLDFRMSDAKPGQSEE